MIEAARIARPPELDEPLRRLVWVLPTAIALWAILLGVFSAMLTRTAMPPPELKPLEARLIEVPPEVGPAPPVTAPRPAAPAVAPKSNPAPALKPRSASPPKTTLTPAPVIRSPYGTRKPTEAPTAETPPPAASAEENEGVGSDTTGARAVYSPTPEIPDDLREDVIDAEAVARFTVSYDGTVTVILEKPTSNPRLNQVLLDTLRQWKFTPAVKNGVAIESSIEVRIPISVQ
ncbi:MAG TPA: TonB family protein [Candidatus Acidoferrales bacterium]|nr:TonB family protein [Candidatus Acidoferrales bacterium]